MQGFKSALREYGLEFDPNFACYVDPGESTSELIISQWLNSENCPTAIITGNGLITMGAVNAIYKAGLSIPAQIAIAGFDDNIWMPHVGPGITVISQPVYEMGRTAAELLFQRLSDPTRPPREVILKGSLLVRGSTRPRATSQ
jgi:LacI family fructose operon transcriptional repressor